MTGRSYRSQTGSKSKYLGRIIKTRLVHFLQKNFDIEMSDRDDIVMLYDRAVELDKKIEGDFEKEEIWRNDLDDLSSM